MSAATFSVPKYRHHKGSGQAFVQVKGKRHYLGSYGSPKSKEAYSRFVAELAVSPAVAVPVPVAHVATLTVVELAAAYLDYAESYYVKNGRMTSQVNCVKLATRKMEELYGRTSAADFGPLALRAIQQRLIDDGLSRKTINSTLGLIKQIFKWAASHEMIPVSTYQATATVPGLRRGRTAAKEPAPVLPVEEAVVEATLPAMSTVVADMVRFQRLTGCRPGEVCQLRPMDLDRTTEVWSYRPASHKTEHHGRQRVIFVGPRAQAVILPYLLREPSAHCFSPAESEAKRYEELRTRRRTKVQPSQWNRRKHRPLRAPTTQFDSNSYNHSIGRAIAKANRQIAETAEAAGVTPALLPAWHPNQLRHTRATEVRKQFGLEATQVVLGHSKADVTQVYAERDQTLAVQVMKAIG
jgi:integrase